MKLDDYQESFIGNIGQAGIKHRNIIAQLETGGGKTVCFSAITYRFIQKNSMDVAIFVDSEKLLYQTVKTLYKWYGIEADIVTAKSSQVGTQTLFGAKANVFVCMVETFDRRAVRESFLSQFKNVGLCIIDECHMGNFIKIFEHFPTSMRIGFTATPVSANKKKPLIDFYSTIVCGPSTEELILFGHENPGRGLVQDITYTRTDNLDINALQQKEKDLGYKGEDYNDKLVSEELSKDKPIQNTIEEYVKRAAGKKMICFNSDVNHSILVTQEMVKHGLNARHLDADCGTEYRNEIYNWLEKTSNAILCNVGMTTKGFDEPSLDGVILNRPTKSKPLYKQMCGRSGRPFQYEDGTYKQYHIIIDMCDNVMGNGHGQWSQYTDWSDLFYNPKRPRKQGVAPSKVCPECGGCCATSARICNNPILNEYTSDIVKCGYEFPQKDIIYDASEQVTVLVTKGVDVEKIVNHPFFANRKEYATLFETIRACAYQYKQSILHTDISAQEFEMIWNVTYPKIKEWQVIVGKKSESGQKKRNNPWYTNKGREMLNQYLTELGCTVEFVKKEEKSADFGYTVNQNISEKVEEDMSFFDGL